MISNLMSVKEQMGKFTIKMKTYALQKILKGECKAKPQTGRKYLQIVCLECGDGLMSVHLYNLLCINSSSINLLENYYKGMKIFSSELVGLIDYNPMALGYCGLRTQSSRLKTL